MKTRNYFFSLSSMLITASLIWSLPLFQAEAQFKKYKSKTDYSSSNRSAPPAAQNNGKSTKTGGTVKNNAPQPANGQSRFNTEPKNDFFGRSNPIPTKTKKNSKYVNLNPETAFGPEIVTSFDFVNTDIMQVTLHMQKLTGINLILDKDVKGKISITAPTPITVGDAWKAYLTALNMNGLTLVKSGAFYKIINTRNVRYSPTKIYTGSYTPNTETYVMRVFPLKHISSTELTRNFRPFMSRYGRLIEIKQTNTIIMADTGANINRLIRLISFLDVPGHEDTLQIIKVHHSSAQEIAKLLETIMKSKSSSTRKTSRRSSRSSGTQLGKIIAEPRTNSIIAMANAESGRKLKALIKKLDVPLVASGSGRINVYYLNYGDAESLAKTLSSLTGGSSGSSKKRSSRFSSSSNTIADLFSAAVKITADKDNNALVVTASPTDYLTIKHVIKKLDVPRDQVYIEGLIMETNVAKLRGFGISFMGAYGTGSAQKAGFDGTGHMVDLLTNNITNLGGLFVGAAGGREVDLDVSGTSIKVNSINGLITAIATNSDTNVLATPQLLVLDNTEGVFEVGETVPVPERTNSANGSSTTAIKEQKVALSLKITPQINKVTRFIKLKIDQKMDDFSNRELGVAEGVGTVTRAANTTVIVRDRDTIAMGGLMRDKEVTTINKVPLLGDIPVLGWLFKNKSTTITKANILFFLTPKILATYEKTAAKTTMDLLNRRSAHLKNVTGGEDPNAVTAKAIYDKVQKQDKGPLYDDEEAKNRYWQENQPENQPESQQENRQEQSLGTPNYQEILKEVENENKEILGT